MSSTCVILQPSYIPWRGYFHQIQKADVFVFYDCVQYDEHGWRNRNRIKTAGGLQWLTIPVVTRGVHSHHVLIKDVRTVPNHPWKAKHWRALQQNYRKAPFFERYAPLLERFYLRPDGLLADFACELTVALAGELGLHHTRFIRSSTLGVTGAKTDRLLEVLARVKATHYVSGPSARDYLEADKFAAAGITLEFMTYDYPEYPQLYPPFDPQVSILDLLFMTGPEAPRFIWDRAVGG
ncbi:MAG: WbqC family protein [Limisphaerales bacterium]